MWIVPRTPNALSERIDSQGRSDPHSPCTSPSPHTHPLTQAYAAWQWWNYLETQVPVGKRLLRINLDETGLCLFQGGRAGAVFCSKRRRRSEPVESASLARRRTYMTHVALICDDTAVQPLLPQFLLGNESTLPARQMHALRASCPANVHLVRQRSAWNDRFMCARIVRALRDALAPHLGGLQPVLLLDMAKLHYTPCVLEACRRAGIWVIFVPAKLTWLLQPLDTGAFHRFKVALAQAYLRARAGTPDGQATIADFILCVCTAIRQVLQGIEWRSVFDGDGFGRRQASLSSLVVHHLQLQGAVEISAVRPTIDQLRRCFPRRARVPEKSLWRPFDGVPDVLPAPAAVAPAVAPVGRGRGGAAAGRGVRGGRGVAHVYGRTRFGAAFKPA